MGIENKYVWAVGTTYDAAGLAQEHTVTDPKDGSVKQKYYTYPRDYKEVVKAGDPISVNVDQLEYRLDKEIIPAGCKGNDIMGPTTPRSKTTAFACLCRSRTPVFNTHSKCSTSTSRTPRAQLQTTSSKNFIS